MREETNNQDEARTRDGAEGLDVAVDLALQPNYLGAPGTVSALLVGGLANIGQLKADGKLTQDTLNRECRRVAGILLGRDPEYTAGPMNAPGRLDEVVRSWTSVDTGDPVADVAEGVARCLKLLAKASSTVEPPEDPERAQAAAMGAAVGLMMGVPMGMLS